MNDVSAYQNIKITDLSLYKIGTVNFIPINSSDSGLI